MHRLAQELGGQSMHRRLRFTVHSDPSVSIPRILGFSILDLRAVAGQVAPVSKQLAASK